MTNIVELKDHPTVVEAEREIGRFHHLLHPRYMPFHYTQKGSAYRMIPAFKFGRMMIEEFKALDGYWQFEVPKSGHNPDTISVEIRDGLIYSTDARSTPTAKLRHAANCRWGRRLPPNHEGTMKVILESLIGMCEREPVIVPVTSYAEARKYADAMARAIMTFWDADNWTYEWTDDRHAFVHHCAFLDEDRCEITIVGDAATAKAENREKCEA